MNYITNFTPLGLALKNAVLECSPHFFSKVDHFMNYCCYYQNNMYVFKSSYHIYIYIYIYIYSHGQKYQHPRNSVRKCNPSLSFLHWNDTKTLKRKVKSDTIPHRTPQMHWAKLLAPYGTNQLNQLLPVTMNEFLRSLYWNFGPWTLLLKTAPGHSD